MVVIEAIVFYGNVLLSFQSEPLSDVSSLFTIGTSVLVFIKILKELTKE